MLTDQILKLIRCPKTHQPIKFAPDELLEKVNRRIAAGTLLIGEIDQPTPLEGGLLTEDNVWLYPIRGGIPTLIGDEAIDVSRF